MKNSPNSKAKWIRRTLLIAFSGTFMLTYLLAKLDFFHYYFRLEPEAYLRRHSIYWVAMAGLAILLWLVEVLFSRERR